VFGAKVVPERGRHHDKPAAPVRQGKDAKVVKYVHHVGDGREQPLGVVFVNALREERNDSTEFMGVGTEFDGCGEKARYGVS